MAETVSQQLQKTVKALTQLSEPDLEIELGRRLQVTSNELASASDLSTARPMLPALDQAELAGPLDFLRRLGQAFLEKLSGQFYHLICDERDPDNSKVKAALGAGVDVLGVTIATLLSGGFGLLPAIAGVVGALLAKRIAAAGHEALCKAWKEQL